MQLKRDTDFALRMLFCLKQHRDNTEIDESNGLTLTEIAAQTGVPRIVAKRICECLQAKKVLFVSYNQEDDEKTFYSAGDLSAFSLLDVIEAVEGTGRLFAAFSRSSSMYKNCKDQILKIQKKTENILSKTSLDSFLSTNQM